MGKLIEAAATFQSPRCGVRSAVDIWLETLADEDRSEAEALLLQRDVYGHSYLSGLIRQVYDVRVTPDAILKWRTRNCT